MELLRDSKMIMVDKFISIAAKNRPFMDEIKTSNTKNVQQPKSHEEKQTSQWERGAATAMETTTG